jgi:hypothetical protein
MAVAKSSAIAAFTENRFKTGREPIPWVEAASDFMVAEIHRDFCRSSPKTASLAAIRLFPPFCT